MRILFAVALLAAFTLARANELPQPTVEYSADSVLTAEGMSMRTRVYHALDKERREVQMQGQEQVMILRMDKGVSWMLMPDSSQFMEMPVAAGLESSGDVTGYGIQITPLGKEKLGPMASTKYQMVLSSPEGYPYEGFMWINDQGIVLKMDAAVKGDQSGARLQMELTNIKIGKQDPKLFEVPAGYTKFDMDAFGGLPTP